MPRVNVWLPDELAATVKADLPEVNISAVTQEALRALLGCRHEELSCRRCAAPIELAKLLDDALGRFYSDLTWELGALVSRGGTAEGAARIAKSVGERFQITMAARLPLPRPTRAEREAAKVKDLAAPAPAQPRLPLEEIA